MKCKYYMASKKHFIKGFPKLIERNFISFDNTIHYSTEKKISSSARIHP